MVKEKKGIITFLHYTGNDFQINPHSIGEKDMYEKKKALSEENN